MHRRLIRTSLTIPAALALLTMAACADVDPGAGSAGAPSSASDERTGGEGATEAGAASARLAISYDGGVQVLDATTLEVLADEEFEGFTRVESRPVTAGTCSSRRQGGFHVLDAGAWEEPHGDHSHFYTAEPHTTGTVFDAEEAGHVVTHAGRTVLFDDGTGDVTAFDSGESRIADRQERTYTTPAAHHGVAVELSDGRLVVVGGHRGRPYRDPGPGRGAARRSPRTTSARTSTARRWPPTRRSSSAARTASWSTGTARSRRCRARTRTAGSATSSAPTSRHVVLG